MQVFLYKDKIDYFGSSITQRTVISLMLGDHNLSTRPYTNTPILHTHNSNEIYLIQLNSGYFMVDVHSNSNILQLEY